MIVKLKSILENGRMFISQNHEKILRFAELSLVAAIFFGAGILFAQTFLYPKSDIKFAWDKEMAEKNLSSLQPAKIKDLLATASKENISQSENRVAAPNLQNQQKGEYVASKNGKTYYKTSCKNQIKEENKIYFRTELDAQKAGFTPSKTCFK